MAPAPRISLDAVIVSVTAETPKVLSVTDPDGGLPRLPSGLLDGDDRTLELALRRLVREQAGLEVGYVEQLYTFGDLDRTPPSTDGRWLSIAYLALVHETLPSAAAAWVDWYELFPWEDQRRGTPAVMAAVSVAVDRWESGGPAAQRSARRERAEVCFGLAGSSWDGVRVLERYELLWELGLLDQAAHALESHPLGRDMQFDHRRIVATALGRLRGKLSYRPVVFELLPPSFTLLQLQRMVEALAGVQLHKQNFRRVVENAGLVEGTGDLTKTGGRPAELFRFRREVVRERPRPGVGIPWTRTT